MIRNEDTLERDGQLQAVERGERSEKSRGPTSGFIASASAVVSGLPRWQTMPRTRRQGPAVSRQCWQRSTRRMQTRMWCCRTDQCRRSGRGSHSRKRTRPWRPIALHCKRPRHPRMRTRPRKGQTRATMRRRTKAQRQSETLKDSPAFSLRRLRVPDRSRRMKCTECASRSPHDGGKMPRAPTWALPQEVEMLRRQEGARRMHHRAGGEDHHRHHRRAGGQDHHRHHRRAGGEDHHRRNRRAGEACRAPAGVRLHKWHMCPTLHEGACIYATFLPG